MPTMPSARNTAIVATFAAAAAVSAYVLHRRYSDTSRVGALRTMLSAYLDDHPPRPMRRNSARRTSFRRRRVGSSDGASADTAAGSAGQSSPAQPQHPLGLTPRKKASFWFGPEVDLEGVAAEIVACSFLPRAQVVQDILRLGFLGRLSSRRERTSELLVSLRMRGVLAEEDLAAGIALWLKTLPAASLTSPRCVKLLCHIVAAEVASDASAFSGLPASTTALVDAALRGDMRVLKQRRSLRKVVSKYMWDGDLFALLDWCVQNVPARYRYEICKKLVQTSISKGALDREQASTTLLTLVRMGIVSVDQAVEGFYRLLWCIDELCLDEPSTPDMVARFIVRAIADEVLPTDFLDTIPDSVLVAKRDNTESPARQTIVAARALIAKAVEQATPEKSARSVIAMIWGASETPSGSLLDAKEEIRRALDKAVHTAGPIISEEARRAAKPEAVKTVDACIATATSDLLDIHLPFYMHEAVLQACILTMEQDSLGAQDLLVRVLENLHSKGRLTPDAVQKGCLRVLECIDALSVRMVSAAHKRETDAAAAAAEAAAAGAATKDEGDEGEAEGKRASNTEDAAAIQARLIARAGAFLVQLSEDLPACLPPTWYRSMPRSWSPRDMPMAFRIIATYDEEYY